MKQEIIKEIYELEKQLSEKYGVSITLTVQIKDKGLDDLVSLVNSRMNLDIRVKSRKREYITGRAIYYTIARDYGYQLEEIGTAVNRDHSLVFHGLKVMRNLLKVKDGHAVREYNKVKELLT